MGGLQRSKEVPRETVGHTAELRAMRAVLGQRRRRRAGDRRKGQMHTPNRACARCTPIGRVFDACAFRFRFAKEAFGAKEQNTLLRKLRKDKLD